MIYLITNRTLVPEERYFNCIKEAAFAGVDKIILREKDLSDEEFKDLYYKVKKITDASNTEIIINSKVNVFKEVGEATIQLSFKDFMELNDKVKGEFGVSVHTLKEGIEANKLGCSYILASHIFSTKCKAGLKPKGVNFIKELKEKVTCKVIALGGINAGNVQMVKKAGADGVAIMSTFFQCDDIKSFLEDLK